MHIPKSNLPESLGFPAGFGLFGGGLFFVDPLQQRFQLGQGFNFIVGKNSGPSGSMGGVDPAGGETRVLPAQDVGGQAVSHHHGPLRGKAGDSCEAGVKILPGGLVVPHLLGDENLPEKPIQVGAGETAFLHRGGTVAGKVQRIFFTQGSNGFLRPGEKIVSDGEIFLIFPGDSRRVRRNTQLLKQGVETAKEGLLPGDLPTL